MVNSVENFLRYRQYEYSRPKYSIYSHNSVTNSQEDKSIIDRIVEKKEVIGIVSATALTAAVLGGILVSGRSRHIIDRLTGENISYRTRINELQDAVNAGLTRIKTLSDDNDSVRSINKRFEEEIQKTKASFLDIFEGDLHPKEVRDRLYETLRNKLSQLSLGYDILKPPVTGKGKKVFDDAIDLPTFLGTQNRTHIHQFDIPKIMPDGSFDFMIPTSSDVKITHISCDTPFSSIRDRMTNISENYADSVQWNNDKIARDILQNFFDGHGQTLDGVHLKFSPVSEGKYRVQIVGSSTYTPDKAIYIGESTKRNNAKAAGNYGEGLKMSVLKLLRDSGAEEVKIGSDQWRLSYSLANSDIQGQDKRILAYSLDNVDRFDGNYVEFETTDRTLLDSFRNSINRFYHSGNKHFRHPDFENELIGIKKLPKGEKGGLYIAGQRFEFNNDYDGLDNIVIFLKEKPPIDILDPSRDRISLGVEQLERIAKWLYNDKRMSKEDKVKFIQSIEPYWKKLPNTSDSPIDKFLEAFLFHFRFSWGGDKTLHINFPEKYVAYSNSTSDVVYSLQKKGYVVCKDGFCNLGMITIRELIGDARAHKPLVPTEIEKKKIIILKEAISSLGDALKKYFLPEELDTKIYLFDKTGAKDSRLYGNTMAEAIIDNGISKGFWLERSYLNSASFGDVFETSLHELCHKVGGDESSEFSYKLTDVNSNVIEYILKNVSFRAKLQALNQLWNDVGN